MTLRTALALRRATEVGVRKACGGNRRALFAQFMSEVFVHVLVATALGVALAAAALPALNAFLNRTIEWQTLFTPAFLGGVAALLVTVDAARGQLSGARAFVVPAEPRDEGADDGTAPERRA